MADMTVASEVLPASWALASLLIGRYGRLALSFATGRAAEAWRNGDQEMVDVWQDVVNDLRHR